MISQIEQPLTDCSLQVIRQGLFAIMYCLEIIWSDIHGGNTGTFP